MQSATTWRDTYKAAKERTRVNVSFDPGSKWKIRIETGKFQRVEPFVDKVLKANREYKRAHPETQELIRDVAASLVKMEFTKTTLGDKDGGAEWWARGITAVKSALLGVGFGLSGLVSTFFFQVTKLPEQLPGARVVFGVITGVFALGGGLVAIKVRRDIRNFSETGKRIAENVDLLATEASRAIREDPAQMIELAELKLDIIKMNMHMIALKFTKNLKAWRESEMQEIDRKLGKIGLRYDENGNLIGAGKN